jgi:hypothetical protein
MVRQVILFVDNLSNNDHIANPIHHLYMDIVQWFDCILYLANPLDGNYKLKKSFNLYIFIDISIE